MSFFDLERIKPLPLVAAVALALASGGHALAMESSLEDGEQSSAETAARTLDTVFVSAQRRSEAAKDVPISILNFDATRLEEAGVRSLSDVQQISSGVRFDRRTNFVVPTIRGITTNIALAGSGTNVGVYIDGFYSPSLQGGDFQLLNVESIQVLKGPQGTLFGRNTSGGAVLVTTGEPSFEPAATVEVGFGNHGSQRYQVYGSTGLGDRVAVDIAALYNDGDGWTTNIVNDDDEIGKFKNHAVRAGILAELTDSFRIVGRYTQSSVDDPSNLFHVPYVIDGQPAAQFAYTPGAIVTTRPGEVSSREPLGYRFKSRAYQLTAMLDMEWADLTSYTQYREDDQTEHKYSLSYTSIPALGLDIHDSNDTFTQELLLTSKSEGPLQYTTGLFFFDAKQSFPYVGIAAGGGDFAFSSASGVRNRSLAAYGDVTYEVRDGLFLTGGLRYTYDTVRDAYYTVGTNSTFLPKLKTERFTPRVVLRYELTPYSSVYGSYSEGYKAALYNVGGFVDDVIEPEEIDSFELGYKYSRANLSFNAASYYYDYRNQQVISGVVVNGVPASAITNAASSTMYGVEGDVSYRFDNGFSFVAGASWSHARYGDFPNAPHFVWMPNNTFPQQPGDASDNHMPRAPDLTANLGAQYDTDFAGGYLNLSASAYHSSRLYFEAANQLEQGAYTTFGARVAWTDQSGRYTFALTGKNIGDKEYRTQGVVNALGVAAIWAPPAQYEASFQARF